jgi:hypothetical protein
VALEAAATERRDPTAATELARAEETAHTRVMPRRTPVSAPAPRPRRAVRAERRARPIKPRRRRGRFTRFMALMFLFLLIVTVVATIVALNLDTSGGRHFEQVVHDRVQDQVNGIRDLIDQATK